MRKKISISQRRRYQAMRTAAPSRVATGSLAGSSHSMGFSPAGNASSRAKITVASRAFPGAARQGDAGGLALRLGAQLAALYQNSAMLGKFTPCYSAFRSTIERAGLVLPESQLAHVLRHIFASHFIKNGGDLLTLQRIFGHSSLNVTMAYSHLSPGFLDQAKNLNPLSRLTIR
jgi:hypothetical protein